jgi:hypothetical protein
MCLEITAGRESWNFRHADFHPHRCESRLRHQSCGSAQGKNVTAQSNRGLEQNSNATAPGSCGSEPNTSAVPSCLVAAKNSRHCCASMSYAAAASRSDSRKPAARQTAQSPPTTDGPTDWLVQGATNRSRGYWNSQISPALGHGPCCCLALPMYALEKHYLLHPRPSAYYQTSLKADGSAKALADVNPSWSYFRCS